MGLGSILGGIAKIGAVAAAPFTGGASLSALPAIDGIGQVAGGAAGGMANQRLSENALINQSNRNQIDLFGTQQNAQTQFAQMMQQALMNALQGQERGKLDRAQFSLAAPQVRGKQALLGSLLQNLQPMSISGLSPQIASRMPKFSGGLSAAAIGPLARQAGLLMQQGSIKGLQGGDRIPDTDFMSGIVDPAKFTMQAPQLQALQKSGLLEKILGGVGLGGSLLGALGKFSPRGGSGSGNPGDGVD